MQLSQRDLRDAQQYLSPDEYNQLLQLVSQVATPDISLVDFVRGGWHVIEPNVPYIHNWHIDVIAEHLECVTWGQIKNLIINIPPRYMKSTLTAVAWQPWVWTFRPQSQWLFFSHSGGYATRDNAKSRRLVQSTWFQQRWGHRVTLREEQNTKGRYENTAGGLRAAKGVGGATGDGGDFLVGDDLLNIEDRNSVATRESTNNFWATTVATRTNTKNTASVIICQRLHEHDIVGFLQEKEQEGGAHYEVLSIPAEYEPGHHTVTSVPWRDPREEPDELLWGNRFGRKEVDQLKVSLGGDSAALLQQRPTPASGGIFKMEWWRFWKPANLDLPPVRLELADGSYIEAEVYDAPEAYDQQIQSWDTTFTATSISAFVVGQVWGKRGANIYLLDEHRKKMETPETILAIQRLTDMWPKAHAKLIENKASGPSVIQTLRNNISGLIPITPKGSKEQRARAVTPPIESGNVYLPHPHIAPWVNNFIDEAVKFPYAQYADRVDAMSQALTRLMDGGGWAR